MINLTGKSVLFISPAFFGYEKVIATRLIEWGAYVDYFDERPANSFWIKGFIRMNYRFLSHAINKYYYSIIHSIKGKYYDYVFIVNIEAMPFFFLHYIRNVLPHSKLILYMWDSVRNKKNTLNYIPLFDVVFSFDRDDCKSFPNIKFRPLFFLNEYEKISQWNTFEYDFSFVGTAHSDRFLLVQNIKKQLSAENMHTYWYLYLQSRKLFIWNKLSNVAYKNARMNDFNYVALPSNELLEIVKKSRIILDIQHPEQTGLTMRTIEVLGAKRKLITTNSSVKNYDFYSPNNILIIDRNHPIINKDFYKSDYVPVQENVYNKYSLNGWLEDIFEEC